MCAWLFTHGLPIQVCVNSHVWSRSIYLSIYGMYVYMCIFHCNLYYFMQSLRSLQKWATRINNLFLVCLSLFLSIFNSCVLHTCICDYLAVTSIIIQKYRFHTSSLQSTIIWFGPRLPTWLRPRPLPFWSDPPLLFEAANALGWIWFPLISCSSTPMPFEFLRSWLCAIPELPLWPLEVKVLLIACFWFTITLDCPKTPCPFPV